MLTPFVIFLVALGGMTCILYRKQTAIKAGKIAVDDAGIPEEGFLADFDFATWKSDVVYYSKIYGHRIVLYILKQWIRFSFWIKEQREKRFPKKEISEMETEKPESAFTQLVDTMKDYKNHLKHVAKKVKEREERKRE